MPSRPEPRPTAHRAQHTQLLTWLAATFGASLLVLLVFAGPSSANAALTLAPAATEVAGPLCRRAPSRPYSNLAGFSLVVGSILILAPLRDPAPPERPEALAGAEASRLSNRD